MLERYSKMELLRRNVDNAFQIKIKKLSYLENIVECLEVCNELEYIEADLKIVVKLVNCFLLIIIESPNEKLHTTVVFSKTKATEKNIKSLLKSREKEIKEYISEFILLNKIIKKSIYHLQNLVKEKDNIFYEERSNKFFEGIKSDTLFTYFKSINDTKIKSISDKNISESTLLASQKDVYGYYEFICGYLKKVEGYLLYIEEEIKVTNESISEIDVNFFDKKINTTNFYDTDACILTWEHFTIAYGNTKQEILSNFNFDINCLKCIPRDDEKSCHGFAAVANKFEIAGDVDFNFNNNLKEIEKKILESDLKNSDKKKYDVVMNKLEICKNSHYTLKNFSLMPVTGGLNSAKGLRGDYFDVFLAELDNYYSLKENREKHPLITTGPGKSVNKNKLVEYLNSFEQGETAHTTKGIVNYCKEIYFIDGELIDKLVNNGNKYIEDGGLSIDFIEKHIELAQEYWEERKIKFTSFYDSDI